MIANNFWGVSKDVLIIHQKYSWRGKRDGNYQVIDIITVKLSNFYMCSISAFPMRAETPVKKSPAIIYREFTALSVCYLW